ncbi:hypothetical protein HanPSC8_Chr05g0214321 [Helianthus annuus]|nr:hypothetical protein HanPSC8_Chr05g0214321 [Helianthus annuus]
MTRLLRRGAKQWKRCEPEWIPAASDTPVGCKVRRICCGVVRVWVSLCLYRWIGLESKKNGRERV